MDAARVSLTQNEALEALSRLADQDQPPAEEGVTVKEFAKAKNWNRERARIWLNEKVAQGRIEAITVVRKDSRGRYQRCSGFRIK